MGDRFSKLAFWASCVLIVFALVAAYGYGVGSGRFWPSSLARETIKVAKSYIKFQEFVPSQRRMKAPEGAARVRALVRENDGAIGSGFYSVLGWNDKTKAYSVWLYDSGGKAIHEWPIDETRFSPSATDNNNAPHAFYILPDGSLVISFDHLATMARLDACGNALWVKDGFFHHAFSPSADGNLWTWRSNVSAYVQDQSVVKFDPMTGDELARVNLIKDVIGTSAENAVRFSVHPETDYVPDTENPADLFHPNDVEELLPRDAAAFPTLDAGDLLLSIRNLDLVVVVDQSGKIKWIQQGPWVHQHDADFMQDGRISVFDNQPKRPYSRIVRIDPVTGAVDEIFRKLPVPFNSQERGKHQYLPNGNVLLTIPEQGQALEVTPDSRVVAEFNNISEFSPEYNEDLVNAKWLPPGYFTQMPTCEN